jgi:DNA replication initiation complex subunit (GINS family)
MVEETITFELIRRIQREEQRTQKLSKLPVDFYDNVQQYLESKRKMSNRKTALELKNAERLVEDIFNRRERKVLNNVLIAARTGIRAENMTDEEKEFFNSMLSVVKERRNLLSSLKEKEGEQQSLIIFKEDVPEFVAVDEKSYGPFKKGDIAKLPGENMQLMIKQGVAEEFKVEK